MKAVQKRGLSLLVGILMLLQLLCVFTVPVFAGDDPEDVAHYISDWAEASARVGWGSLMKDRGLEDLPIRLLDADKNVVPYEKGLVAHAASEVTYNLEGEGAKRFQAYVGVNYPKEGSCGFYVYADDTELFGLALLRHGESQVYVDVAIPEGAQTLRLVTTDGGDGMNSDHSVWADAKVLCDGLVQSQLQSVAVEAEKSVLAVGETIALTAVGAQKSGRPADLSEADILFESADPAIATVTGDGALTAVAEGMTTIRCTVTLGDIICEAAFYVVVSNGQPETEWTLKSPGETNSIAFALEPSGALTYSAKHGDETLVEDSPTGIKTNVGDFTSGLVFAASSTTVVDETYELMGAKVSSVRNHANELTITFLKNGVVFQVVARAYEDGVAFRYGIQAQDGETLTIQSEHTGVQLPAGTINWSADYQGPHETLPSEKTMAATTGTYTMPMLYKTTAGTYGLISEAALSPAYCGAALRGDGSGMVNVIFAPEQATSVVTTVPFVSPWRFVVMGTSADINATVMPENLSPPCEIEDTSWIEPGVTAWTWLNGEGTSSLATYKRYVDLAADMGWQYLLLDEGWQPGAPSGSGRRYQGYYSWMDELVAYADEKGVGLLVWAYHSDLADPEYCEQLFAEWHEMGIKGLKPDFFDSQAQSVMQTYDRLMRLSAKYELVLNPHGANKPTGERRTWPNALTREGIFGAEQDPYRPAGGVSKYNCLVPFIRNAVGPADYTPMFSKYRTSGSNQRLYSLAHQAALAVIYDSGIQCLSDRDSAYLNSPARDFFYNLPTGWDESQMLAGEPGVYVNMAKRSGANWYVGAICDTPRDAVIDLGFLEEGATYYASIFKDGSNIEEIVPEYRMVTREDTLTIPMIDTGGVVVKIMAEDPGMPESIRLSETGVTLRQNESFSLTATLDPEDKGNVAVTWASSNPQVASVGGGKVSALQVGTALITAGCTNPFTGESISATCEVTVTPPDYTLTTDWEILANVPTSWKLNDEGSVSITSLAGEFHGTIGEAKNIFLTPVSGDFEATVRMEYAPTLDFQTAGLIVYGGNNAMLNVVRRSHSSFNREHNIFALTQSNAGSFRESNPPKADLSDYAPVYLRLVRSGSSYSGYYRFSEEEEWTLIDTFDNGSLSAESLKVGLYCVNGNGKNTTSTATFTEFKVNGTAVSFGKETAKTAALEALYNRVKGETEELYTPNSWQPFAAALADAKAVLEQVDPAVEEIDNAFAALEAAHNGLALRAQDAELDVLGVFLQLFEGFEENYYTANSWIPFKAAVAEARGLMDDPANASSQAVTAALNNMIDTSNALVLRANKNDLDTLSIFAGLFGSFTEENYTPESWAPLQAALDKAAALLADPLNAPKAEVEATTEALIDAGNALVEAMSRAPLQAAIAEAEALRDKEGAGWIPASLENLQKAIDKAKALLQKEDLTQEEMVAMILELNDAMSNMFEKGNKAPLQLLVNSANQLDAARFTPDSWAKVADAMAAAQKVLDDANAVAEDVSQAYTALTNAIGQLVTKANPSGLKTALELADTILANIDAYIPGTVEGLQAERDKAQIVYDDPNATQDEMNAAQNALMAKVMAARKPANKQALKGALGRIGQSSLGQAALGALAEAERVLNDPDATQSAVDEALSSMLAAAKAPYDAALAEQEKATATGGAQQAAGETAVTEKEPEGQQLPLANVPAGIPAEERTEENQPAPLPADTAEQAAPAPEEEKAAIGQQMESTPNDAPLPWAGIVFGAAVFLLVAVLLLQARKKQL